MQFMQPKTLDNDFSEKGPKSTLSIVHQLIDISQSEIYLLSLEIIQISTFHNYSGWVHLTEKSGDSP